MNILVLCTGNSARSILAEVLINSLCGKTMHAYSAGSKPVGAVNPHALALLEVKGHNISGLRSKSWDEFSKPSAPKMDAVITVCGNAASEACPIWPGAPVRIHWGFDDPAHILDTLEASKAFEETYKAIKCRVEDFMTLPLDTLDASALQSAMQALAPPQTTVRTN